MNTGSFKTFDNNELFYREWNYSPSKKTLIVLHRGHEHSERLSDFATSQLFSQFNIFSFDFRGHGYTKVEVSPFFMDYVRDLEYFFKFLQHNYNINPQHTFVVANSIAGVIASAWVHDYAPKIAGMALIAPAFEIKLYVPFANEFISMATSIKKNLIIESYVKSKVLTHDVEQQKAYDNDPLITKSINAKLLIDLQQAGKRLVQDAAAISIPTLILSAQTDYVVKNSVQKKFYLNISSPIRKFVTLNNFYHGILFESNKDISYNIIHDFVKNAFVQPSETPNLVPDNFTLREYETMVLKMLPFTEKLNFAFQKFSLSKIGKLSKGMKIGLTHGFDSGISLDYVYKNKPQGNLLLGKFIDRGYLNAIGWKGIRIRKQHLIQLLEKKIIEIQKTGQQVKILDIAGGTGNYLFDIKEKFPETEIVINDFVIDNVKFGEKIIKHKDYKNIRFTNYSCFDSDTYSKLNFQPNIIIISGIFELFGDNQLINQAMQGIVSIAQKNSTLLYTGQPWHPQLKMIAFVLKSHQNKDWVMRRRSQNELDRIMSYNQIHKQEMRIDNFGIFTVSSAKVNHDTF